MAFSLLDLPTEIRQLIVSYTLFISDPFPVYPSKANRCTLNDINYLAWRARPYHEIRSSHSPSNSLPLLLISKQIHAETKPVLALETTAAKTYHLDISVENDNDLFPTWLCIPQLTTELDKLYVDIRLFGTIIEPRIGRSQGGDGGHKRYEWDFLALLERFLRYGPVGQKKTRNEQGEMQDLRVDRYGAPQLTTDRVLKVNTLVLDFSSGEDKLGRGEFPPREVTFRDWDFHRMGVRSRTVRELGVQLEWYNTRPEWLAMLLGYELQALLMFGRDRELFAKLVYERIGEVKVLVDGKAFREFDVKGLLTELKMKNTSLRKTIPKDLEAPDWVFEL